MNLCRSVREEEGCTTTAAGLSTSKQLLATSFCCKFPVCTVKLFWAGPEMFISVVGITGLILGRLVVCWVWASACGIVTLVRHFMSSEFCWLAGLGVFTSSVFDFFAGVATVKVIQANDTVNNNNNLKSTFKEESLATI